MHKAYAERFDLVPDRFPSNSVLQQRRRSRRRRLAAQLRPEITFFEHYISVACAPYDTSLFKIRSAIDCVWAICIAPIVRKLAHDSGLVRQTLAPEFGSNKIAAEATEGCVLEVGIGPTAAVDLRGVVDAEGAAYAIFWSAEGDQRIPIEHYVSLRAALSKSMCGDAKSFPRGQTASSLRRTRVPLAEPLAMRSTTCRSRRSSASTRSQLRSRVVVSWRSVLDQSDEPLKGVFALESVATQGLTWR